jgi:hypothetical protein
MNYQNRLSAFQSSVAENQSGLDNYLAKKKGIQETNKELVGQAKSLAQQHLTAESLKGIGMEGAIRILKPQATKILSWADKKVLGGQVSRDTEAFKGRIKTKLGNIKDSLKERAKRSSGMEEDDGEQGTEMTGGEVDDVRGNMPSNEISETSGVEPSPTEGMTEQSGGLDMADREYDLFGQTDHPSHWSNTGEENPNGRSDFANDAQADEETETKYDDEVKETKEENEDIDKGDTPEEAEKDVEGEGDEAGEGLAEGAGEEGVDEGIGAGLEGAGTALDATGYGAVVGIPLQIAGAVLEAGGLYEAGKSVVDWFEQDILGEKPKINPHQIAMPKRPSTLAGQGLQATPTFDTTMDVGGGVGGW